MSSLNPKKINSIKTLLLNESLECLYPWPVKDLPNSDGCYVYWWTGDLNVLKKALLDSDFKYYLKKSHKLRVNKKDDWVNVKYTPCWVEASTHTLNDGRSAVCLYVGKTTNLKKRITGHVRPNTPNIWDKGIIDQKHKPENNTVSQLRIGLERIFGFHFYKESWKDVSINYVSFPKDIQAINRFYAENRLIGELFPLLNIDVER